MEHVKPEGTAQVNDGKLRGRSHGGDALSHRPHRAVGDGQEENPGRRQLEPIPRRHEPGAEGAGQAPAEVASPRDG